MKSVRHFRSVLSAAMFLVAVSLFSPAMFATTVFTVAHPQARITKPVNDAKRATLYGHVPQVVKHASPSAREE